MFMRVVLGILLVAAGFMAWRELEPLGRFQPADAVVLSARIEHRTMRVHRPRGGWRTRSGYVPDVSYRYEVAGRTYVGSDYARTSTLESSNAARQHLQGVVPGTTIRVWYNPSNPSEAVIARAPNAILLTIMAAVVFFVWLFSLAFRPRTAREPMRAAA